MTAATGDRIDIEALKMAVPVQVVVAAHPALGPIRQVSRDRWEGVEGVGERGHSSLVLVPSRHLIVWYAAGRHWDQLGWLMEMAQFEWWDAIEEMERLAGMPAHSRASILDGGHAGGVVGVRPSKPQPRPAPPTTDEVSAMHLALCKQPAALAWLAQRYAITIDDTEQYQLGYCHNHWGAGPTVSIPVWDFDGTRRRLRTIRHRYMQPVNAAAPPSRRYVPHVAGLGAWPFGLDELPFYDEAIVCEGEFKAITIRKHIGFALGLPGCDSFMPAAYSQGVDPGDAAAVVRYEAAWYARFRHLRRVYVMLDPGVDPVYRLSRDAYGRVTDRRPRQWVYRLAQTAEVLIVTLPDKPDDMLMRAGGVGAVESAIRMADPLPPVPAQEPKSRRS